MRITVSTRKQDGVGEGRPVLLGPKTSRRKIRPSIGATRNYTNMVIYKNNK